MTEIRARHQDQMRLIALFIIIILSLSFALKRPYVTLDVEDILNGAVAIEFGLFHAAIHLFILLRSKPYLDFDPSFQCVYLRLVNILLTTLRMPTLSDRSAVSGSNNAFEFDFELSAWVYSVVLLLTVHTETLHCMLLISW